MELLNHWIVTKINQHQKRVNLIWNSVLLRFNDFSCCLFFVTSIWQNQPFHSLIWVEIYSDIWNTFSKQAFISIARKLHPILSTTHAFKKKTKIQSFGLRSKIQNSSKNEAEPFAGCKTDIMCLFPSTCRNVNFKLREESQYFDDVFVDVRLLCPLEL